MAVKAQWFVPDLAGDDVDPLDEGPIDVAEAGVTIDLRDDPEVLFRRLADLLEQESRLFNRGVRCPVKDKSDTSCAACPFQGRHGSLCTVGVEQEQVLTRMSFAEQERHDRSSR